MKQLLRVILIVVLFGCGAAGNEIKKVRIYLTDVKVKYLDKESPRLKSKVVENICWNYRGALIKTLQKENKQASVEFVAYLMDRSATTAYTGKAEAFVLPLIIVKDSKYYAYARVSSTKGSYSRELQPVAFEKAGEAENKIKTAVLGAFSVFKDGLGEEQKALCFEDGAAELREFKLDEVAVNVIRESGLGK